MLARETGWTHDHLQRRTPLALLVRMYHAILWGNGAWTIRKSKDVELETLFPAAQIAEEEDDE